MKKRLEKRILKGDIKFNNKLVSKLISMIMWSGKKSLAQKIVYNAFDILKKQTNKDPIEVFTAAVNNVKPKVEVKSRRVGGATYQVPVEVDNERGITLALRWIRESARSKKGSSFAERISNELLAAYKNEGDAVKKKQNTHKMAEANKAFAHYNW